MWKCETAFNVVSHLKSRPFLPRSSAGHKNVTRSVNLIWNFLCSPQSKISLYVFSANVTVQLYIQVLVAYATPKWKFWSFGIPGKWATSRMQTLHFLPLNWSLNISICSCGWQGNLESTKWSKTLKIETYGIKGLASSTLPEVELIKVLPAKTQVTNPRP